MVLTDGMGTSGACRTCPAPRTGTTVLTAHQGRGASARTPRHYPVAALSHQGPKEGISMRLVATFALAVSLLTAGRAQGQTRIVTGRVTDSLTQEVVTSGQVSVQGTSVGTVIKDDGTFTIAVPSRDVVLVVRSIGFKRKDLAIPASQNSVNVALERDYFQLEAIVVTGQATGVERKNLANAVASVSAEQLAKAPTASVEQSLQGKLAGAQITMNTFAPGGGVMVRLRGVTSINGNFTPLYVVDGVIVSDAA